ncbi:MAG: inositol monophosphatase family protein [Pseudonocardia sp.]
MTADDPERLRGVAVRVAREAADLVVRMREQAVRRVHTKSSGTDVVTAADTEVERLLRTRLAQLCPGDAVLGEEGGIEGLADRAAQPGQVCWVLDPIDGTTNYLYGLPWFSVSVAATRSGVGLAGVVAEPASGRMWSAALGGGATLDGHPLRVSGTDRLDLALLGTGFGYRADQRARQGELAAALLPRIRDLRRFGSAALDLCAVAAGWLDGYYEHGIHHWDWAAGALIAAEAGAVVHPAGTSRSGSLFLAAAPGVAGELVRTLDELGAHHF